MKYLFIVILVAISAATTAAKSLLLLTTFGLFYKFQECNSRSKLSHACPVMGKHFIPDAINCNKLYECKDGYVKDSLHCRRDTAFSYEKQRCVWPEQSECVIQQQQNKTPPSETSFIETTLNATIPMEITSTATNLNKTTNNVTIDMDIPFTATDQNKTSLSVTDSMKINPNMPTEIEKSENGCPVDIDKHIIFEHEIYCTHFYICMYGEKILQKCDRGTSFNILIPGCDLSENVDRTCADIESSEEDTANSFETLNGTVNFFENGCPGDFDVQMYIPHETYCFVFYECRDGKKLLKACPPSTHFSIELQGCVSPEHSECNSSEPYNYTDPLTTTDALSLQNITDTEIFINGCPRDFQINKNFHHETSCSLFYQCVDGEKILKKCDHSSNVGVEACNQYFKGNCGDLITVTKVPNNETTRKTNFEAYENGCPIDDRIKWHIAHEDCDKFNFCVYGQLVESVCPTRGTHFNPKLQVCGDPLTAGCINTSCPYGEDCGIEEGYKHSEHLDMSNKYSNEDIKCAESTHVLPFPHKDCDKFYVCKGNKAQLRICSEGLYFNPITYICDYLEHVNCNNVNYRVSPRKEGLSIYIPWYKLWNVIKQILVS